MTGVDEGFGIGVTLARGEDVSVMESWTESSSGLKPAADGSGEGCSPILRYGGDYQDGTDCQKDQV